LDHAIIHVGDFSIMPPRPMMSSSMINFGLSLVFLGLNKIIALDIIYYTGETPIHYAFRKSGLPRGDNLFVRKRGDGTWSPRVVLVSLSLISA
jgi:hypothetical protein